MPRYRTEIVIPPDHTITLLLPDYLPEGLATITVTVGVSGVGNEGPAGPGELPPGDPAAGRVRGDDYEWWEEFEGESGRAG